jgi:hypothetical protein
MVVVVHVTSLSGYLLIWTAPAINLGFRRSDQRAEIANLHSRSVTPAAIAGDLRDVR